MVSRVGLETSRGSRLGLGLILLDKKHIQKNRHRKG